jgi:MFS family permease
MGKTLRYGWIIVGTGLLVKMAALGFGRFSYPMLIPSMRESLSLHYGEMGLLSGGILLGYLLFSFIGGALATRFGSKRVVVASLLCSSLCMFGVSRSSYFPFLLFFTFGLGAGAAGGHIAMTTLPMAWFGKRTLGKAVGIVTGGTGVGVIVVGLLIPPLLLTPGGGGWRGCWSLMGLMTLGVAAAGMILLRERPGPGPFPAAPEEKGGIPRAVQSENLSLKVIVAAYFVFGVAYNIYATYFVSFMIEDLRISERTAGMIWSVFGWTSIGSGLIWGYLSDHAGRRKALLWNNALISLAALLPLCLHAPLALGLSSFLFGFTFLGTVTVVAAIVGDQTVERKATAYGLITLIHGLGQLFGTSSGGYLKDLTGSFSATLLVSLIGFLICFVLIAAAGHKSDPAFGEA